MRHRRIMPFFAALLLLSHMLWSAPTYKNIVVASGKSRADAEIFSIKVKRVLEADPEYRRLRQSEGFKVHTRPSGKYYIATIEPFHNDQALFYVLDKVYAHFPDAFVFTHEGEGAVAAPEDEAVPAVDAGAAASAAAEPAVTGTTAPEAQEDSVLLYLILLLGIIGIVLSVRSMLQQRKLKRYNRQLDEGHRQLEEVIGRQEDIMVNIGQKIQAPVKEISASSEKILKTQLDPIQSKEFLNIKSSDELLLDITNDLIDYLNLKSEKLSLRHEVFNINNVLDEMAGVISSRARGSKVEFIFDIEKEVPAKLIGDPLRLGQILTNLLGNAMKFTSAGEVRLHIRRVPDYAKSVLLEFTISDTGIGIDPAHAEEVFEPFSMVNDVNETGLGLYISRALTQMMKGTIELKSEINKGTTFFIRIPFDVPDPNEKRHYRLPSKAYAERKVVIVEVQPTAADALKKMLEYFKNDVAVRSVGAIENKSDILFESEIVIVAENAFTPEIKSIVRRVKTETDAKIVLAGSMLDAPHPITSLEPLIDARIMKPLNLQRVFDLIVDLFEGTVKDDADQQSTARHTSPTAFKQTSHPDVPETQNISKSSFSRFAGGSVLIVEDNLINQKVLLSLLNGSGISVKVANDGLEALDAIEDEANDFDLVLMDINMPVMDGYEATRHIRKVSIFDDLPIVSLTGLGLPEEVAKMYAIGMNAHLTKPVQIGRLYTVFARYLAKEDSAGAQNASAPSPDSKYGNTPVLAAANGLKMASGDEELYEEILDEFVRLYVSADDALATMMRTGDADNAKKLCLDIKGVGSNIGAGPLTQAAAALHEALSTGEREKYAALTETFNTALHDVVKEIRKYLR